MKNGNVDMTSGSFAKNIVQFTIPLILTAMLQILFIACDDMLILGAFVGSKALAAVGATNYIVNLFVNTFLGLSVGINVVVAQSIGAEDRDKTQKAVHTAIASSIIFGILLATLGKFFSGTCLELMNTPADIIDQSALYLSIYFLSTPATLIFSFGSAILRAQGDSHHPFVYMTIAGIADVILCAFFVIICHLDVAGVALGTLMSQYLSSILVIKHLMREKGICNLSLHKLKVYGDVLKEILRIGIPSGLSSIIFSISNMQIQSSINLFGSAAVAGCSASSTIEGFVYAATNSVMQAAISFTGQNAGAKKYDNIPKVLVWCLIYSSVIGTVLGGLVLLIDEPLLSLFIEPSDVEFAILRNRIILIPFMFCGTMDTFAGTLRGLGKAALPTAVYLIGVCGFRILWVHTVFKATMSLKVLFMSYPISWVITTAAHFVCYLVVMKRIRQSSETY
mgnify:CR=1 FL=1